MLRPAVRKRSAVTARVGVPSIMKPTFHVSIERARAEDGPPILQLLSAAQLPVDGLLSHLDTAVVVWADGRVVGCEALEILRGRSVAPVSCCR